MSKQLMDVRIARWEEDYDLIRLVRITVFCQEQSIPQDIDFDGLDPECRHVLAFTNSGEPRSWVSAPKAELSLKQE